MMDSLGMILMVIIYLFVALAEGKKKKRKKQARRRDEKTAFEEFRSAAGQVLAKARENAQAGAETSKTHACETQQIHLHDVPQAVMEHAGEGEDPCHAGGTVIAAGEPDPAQEEPDFDGDFQQSEAAQDLLRGVIMSEILTRPCERRAMQRNRRSI